MKKINSILAIATVALTSVFGFTSCDKNDDPFYQPAQPVQPIENVAPVSVPQTSVDAYLYVAATAEQLKHMDGTYTLSVDGQTKVVKLSEMNEVKDKQRLADSEYMLEGYRATPDEKISEAKIYEFHLGYVKNVSITSMKYTAFTEMADHEIDAFSGARIKSGSAELFSTGTINYFRGFKEVANVAERMSTYRK